MTQHSLASALNAALQSSPRHQTVRALPTPWLVTALSNSTTEKDLIVQRRIGLTISSPRAL